MSNFYTALDPDEIVSSSSLTGDYRFAEERSLSMIPMQKLDHYDLLHQLTKQNKYDAGFDIHSNEDFDLGPMEQKLISTGVAIKIPPGNVGLIWPRSGLSVKKQIETGAGVIDSTYTGEVKVLLRNVGLSDTHKFYKGDRIAQLLIMPLTECEGVYEVDELPDTDRGDRGFGSSGA